MRHEVLTNGNNTVNIPLNLRRFIWNAQNQFDCGPDKPPVPDLMATEIVDRIKVRRLTTQFQLSVRLSDQITCLLGL